ncbi:MAG: diaminopimelate epimerase [Holosporaceae bacterium]|jgi:diaminopimelate epimerase|nr:diaminopimelate epimerase [Holosporaceae bacterium]
MIKFDKMQSNGNDFVMLDESQQAMSHLHNKIPHFCKTISDRKFGIGCDLITLYRVGDENIVHASFFNSDGSEAEICGNAACCLALLMKIRHSRISCILKTKNKTYELLVDDKNAISINFGRPSCDRAQCGMHSLPPNLLEYLEDSLGDAADLFIKIGAYYAVALSVGNPHLVLLVTHMPSMEQAAILGSLLEKNELFQRKTNVSFAKILPNGEISLVVFERAEGLTLACGSGAVATAWASFMGGFTTPNNITVRQRGGSVTINIVEDGDVFQVSSAVLVFSGVYYSNAS